MSRRTVTLSVKTIDVEAGDLRWSAEGADAFHYEPIVDGDESTDVTFVMNMTGSDDDLIQKISTTLDKRGILFRDLRVVDVPLAHPSDLVDAIATAIRAIIPANGLEGNVEDLFPDEIEYSREGDWDSFAGRREGVWKLRVERAARAAAASVMDLS
jgi:hypothetical protein